MLGAESGRTLKRRMRALLTEWRGYDLIEPFGFPNDERRHVSLCVASSRGLAKVRNIRYQPPEALRPRGRYMTAEEFAKVNELVVCP